MICDRLKQTNEVYHINLRSMGSFCDFEAGSSPEDLQIYLGKLQ
jgi:hypothetical protein